MQRFFFWSPSELNGFGYNCVATQQMETKWNECCITLLHKFATKSCDKILRQSSVAKLCGKTSRHSLAAKFRGEVLRQNFAAKIYGEILQQSFAAELCTTLCCETLLLMPSFKTCSEPCRLDWNQVDWTETKPTGSKPSRLGVLRNYSAEFCAKVLRQNLAKIFCRILQRNFAARFGQVMLSSAKPSRISTELIVFGFIDLCIFRCSEATLATRNQVPSDWMGFLQISME